MTHRLAARARRALIIAASLAGTACGHLGVGQATDDRAWIVFRNESLDQATVYAIAPGSDWVRLGTVFPGHADTLVVRGSLVSQGSGVNIIARLLAKSYAPQSGSIPLRPGDLFEVRLPPDERQLIAVPGR